MEIEVNSSMVGGFDALEKTSKENGSCPTITTRFFRSGRSVLQQIRIFWYAIGWNAG